MFKFLICSAAFIPATFLPFIANGNSTELDVAPQETSMDSKLAAIADCNSEAIAIHFSQDIYVETHSASYLGAAIESAKNCDFAEARVVGFTSDSSTAEEASMTFERVEEVAAYMEAYNFDYENAPTLKTIPVNSAMLNGLTVNVEFSFNEQKDTTAENLYLE